ncbi:MAG: hypothetical protein JRJ15_09100 [Deltaproteobacteria bacterium]|nr:hypothetical protein [Deltaproteobacteria bacterium]
MTSIRANLSIKLKTTIAGTIAFASAKKGVGRNIQLQEVSGLDRFDPAGTEEVGRWPTWKTERRQKDHHKTHSPQGE